MDVVATTASAATDPLREALLTGLREQIDLYLAGNPVRNLLMLSRDSGVAETTLRRIYNRQGSTPNPDTVVRLLSFLSGETTIPGLCERFSGGIASFLKQSFPFLARAQARQSNASPVLNEALRDFTAYVIFKRVSHSDPVTRRDVESWLGEMGRVRLDGLVAAELIGEKADGTLFCHSRHFSITDADLLRSHASQLIAQFHKPRNAMRGGPSMLRSVSESVSAEGARKVKAILDEASRRILETLDTHPGQIPLMFVGAVDTLDFRDYPAEGVRS
ncbi:MAG TPA: hypothetical protein VL588_02455 [Bdellovibrionota bacterium]|nr:hypothetical protein [Bdellovibrionota bacterium]